MRQQRLWAPWREAYLASMKKDRSKSCLFCLKGHRKAILSQQVLTRGRFSYCLLNRFPYINGHLLIAPYRHVGRLELLTQEEWLEFFQLATDALLRLKKAMSPDGYNIGINLGRTAGAGIPGHMHLHIVPRWQGDTNFMPTVAQMKVISQSLQSTYRLLKSARP